MAPPAFGLTAGAAQTKAAPATQLKPEPQKAAEPKVETLADKLDAIDDPQNAKVKRAKVKALMEFVRAQEATYPAKIAGFKDQPNPTTEEKLRVMGEISVMAERAEWLIGTILLEGSDDSKKWETSANNDKDKLLAGYYQKQTGSDDKTFGATPWCTKFLGAIKKNVLGLRNKKGKSPNGELWSGSKLGNADNFDYNTAAGGKHIGASSGGFGKDKDSKVVAIRISAYSRLRSMNCIPRVKRPRRSGTIPNLPTGRRFFNRISSTWPQCSKA